MERQRIKRTWCLSADTGSFACSLYGRNEDSAGGYLEWHFS